MIRRPPRSTLFPTRRSSDLHLRAFRRENFRRRNMPYQPRTVRVAGGIDRKSTRLNSSHMSISYAVFCLKKKKKQSTTNEQTQHKTRHKTAHSPEKQS